MHPALRVPDIIYLIVSFVDSRRDLRSLLITCTLFEGQSRARLWRCIPDADILARMLPKVPDVDAKRQSVPTSKVSTVEDNSTIGRGEFQRFELYASVVQDLTFKRTDNDQDNYMLNVWDAYSNGCTLLPQLQAVRLNEVAKWSGLNAKFHRLLTRLVGQSPTALYLHQARSPSSSPPASTSLVESPTPSSEKLVLHLTTASGIFLQDPIEIVDAFSRLEEFSASIFIGERMLEKLAALPSLRSLVIGYLMIDSLNTPPAPFPVLERLSISASGPTFLTLLLSKITSPVLHSITLGFFFSPGNISLGVVEVNNTVVAMPCRNALRYIRYEWKLQPPPEPSSEETLSALGTPLVGLPSLREVDLSPLAISVRDPDKFWRLHPLIEAPAFARTVIPISLSVLREFVHTRPEITALPGRLAVFLDVCNKALDDDEDAPIPEIEDLAIFSTEQCGPVRTLAPAAHVAQQLRTCFPRVKEICVWQGSCLLWGNISKEMGISWRKPWSCVVCSM